MRIAADSSGDHRKTRRPTASTHLLLFPCATFTHISKFQFPSIVSYFPTEPRGYGEILLVTRLRSGVAREARECKPWRYLVVSKIAALLVSEDTVYYRAISYSPALSCILSLGHNSLWN